MLIFCAAACLFQIAGEAGDCKSWWQSSARRARLSGAPQRCIQIAGLLSIMRAASRQRRLRAPSHPTTHRRFIIGNVVFIGFQILPTGQIDLNTLWERDVCLRGTRRCMENADCCGSITPDYKYLGRATEHAHMSMACNSSSLINPINA